MIAEFDIYYLSYEDIASGIEQEAKKQAKSKILTFFRTFTDILIGIKI